MPLLILTGLPCSGKTHRASQIAAEFRSRLLFFSPTSPEPPRRHVLTVLSHHATLDSTSSSTSVPAALNPRDQIYNSASAEKTARAEEFSAIKRGLSKDTIVIADGLNYIKGYRYQLWCEAKAAGTRCVVVHVASREDECVRWNNERLIAAGRENEAAAAQDKNEISGAAILQPESHTAIYGDNVVAQDVRSRSSSIDGELDVSRISKPQDDEGLTLKSLYLSDQPMHTRGHPKRRHDSTEAEQPTQAQIRHTSLPYALPSAVPPLPSSSQAYARSTLHALIMRYEPPSPFSRWDTPLFVVPTSDLHPPYDEIWNAIFPPLTSRTSKKSHSVEQDSRNDASIKEIQKEEEVKQHQATTLPPATVPDALQLLERTTAAVITCLLRAYREESLDNSGPGGLIVFSVPIEAETVEVEITIPPGMHLTQPVLQRLKRKYTQLQRGGIAHGVGHVSGTRREAVSGFGRFLNAEFGTE